MRRNLISAIAILILISGNHSFAGCQPEEIPKPNITNSGVAYYFSQEPIDNSKDIVSTEKRLILTSRDCKSGEERKIDAMPYLSDTGEIVDIFTTPSPKELFVIHKVEIISDTGIPYSSAYHTVLAYTLNGLNSSLNSETTEHFSFGADILKSNSNENLYTFPYKTKKSIEDELHSKFYKELKNNKEVKSTILRKTYLYSYPVVTEKLKSHLVSGDTALITRKQANWCKINYETRTKKLINGWIFCSELKISQNQKQ